LRCRRKTGGGDERERGLRGVREQGVCIVGGQGGGGVRTSRYTWDTTRGGAALESHTPYMYTVYIHSIHTHYTYTLYLHSRWH